MAKHSSLPETITPYPVVADITFAEGPAFDAAGNLYFVNYHAEGTLGRMAPDGTVEVWAHTGGRANGAKYDGRGHIVVADPGARRITRFDTTSREMEVLTDEFEGERYNGPNDVCLDLGGNIYFTDPPRAEGQSGCVYRIAMDEANRPAAVRRLDEDLPYPNGLAVHPGQRRMYVALTHFNSIVSYQLSDDGNLSDREMVYEFPTESVDGIAFDEEGRLWVARWLHGTVDVLDVELGEVLRSYPMGGDRVTNLAWRGESLYVTVAGSNGIERLDAGVRSANIVPA